MRAAAAKVGRQRTGVNVLIQVCFSFITGLNHYIRIKYMIGSCKPQTVVLARNAMMYHGLTLLLAAAVLTVMTSAAESSKSCAGHSRVPVWGGGVTLFVCSHCTATCQLSSSGLFLNRVALQRHISTSKHCFAADLGFQEIQVDARVDKFMAGGWGRSGPAPDARHQQPGDAKQQ